MNLNFQNKIKFDLYHIQRPIHINIVEGLVGYVTQILHSGIQILSGYGSYILEYGTEGPYFYPIETPIEDPKKNKFFEPLDSQSTQSFLTSIWMSREEYIRKMKDLITKWKKKTYDAFTCNCFHFVKDVVHTLTSNNLFPLEEENYLFKKKVTLNEESEIFKNLTFTIKNIPLRFDIYLSSTPTKKIILFYCHCNNSEISFYKFLNQNYSDIFKHILNEIRTMDMKINNIETQTTQIKKNENQTQETILQISNIMVDYIGLEVSRKSLLLHSFSYLKENSNLDKKIDNIITNIDRIQTTLNFLEPPIINDYIIYSFIITISIIFVDILIHYFKNNIILISFMTIIKAFSITSFIMFIIFFMHTLSKKKIETNLEENKQLTEAKKILNHLKTPINIEEKNIKLYEEEYFFIKYEEEKEKSFNYFKKNNNILFNFESPIFQCDNSNFLNNSFKPINNIKIMNNSYKPIDFTKNNYDLKSLKDIKKWDYPIIHNNSTVHNFFLDYLKTKESEILNDNYKNILSKFKNLNNNIKIDNENMKNDIKNLNNIKIDEKIKNDIKNLNNNIKIENEKINEEKIKNELIEREKKIQDEKNKIYNDYQNFDLEKFREKLNQKNSFNYDFNNHHFNYNFHYNYSNNGKNKSDFCFGYTKDSDNVLSLILFYILLFISFLVFKNLGIIRNFLALIFKKISFFIQNDD
jgi:hypothetical protein